jgi:DNA-binding SARP family transcriptional activator
MEVQTEVRVLGPLIVRDADGKVVDRSEWRTKKTRCLLRMLALQVGQPLQPDVILEALWGDVDEPHARASLRNAASRIRHVLGESCLHRSGGGLVLQNVWVDAQAFETLARTARASFRERNDELGERLAVKAAAMYGGDVDLEDLEEDRSRLARERLRALHLDLLLDAADATERLGRPYDSLEWARRATAVDEFSERACRSVMAAYAAIGEVGAALDHFERCRRALAEKLGADPSMETRAMHLQLLQEVATAAQQSDFVGRVRELGLLSAAVADAVREHRPTMVLVAGPLGSGKNRLIMEASRNLPRETFTMASGGDVRALAGDPYRGVVLLKGLNESAGADVEELRRLLETVTKPMVLLAPLRTPSVAPDLESSLAGMVAAGLAVRIDVGSLSGEEASRMCASVIGGPPAPALLVDLTARAGSLPGPLLEAARALKATTPLASSPQGLVRAPRGGDAAGEGQRAVAGVRSVLSPEIQVIFDYVSVLRRDITVEGLGVLLDQADEAMIRSGLEALEDAGVLVAEEGVFQITAPSMEEAAYAWLRPSTRRELHSAIAGSPFVSTADRAHHWLAAGETELACAALLDAAHEHLERGDYPAARTSLLRLQPLADTSEMSVADRLELLESLAAACRGSNRVEDSRRFLDEAIALATSSHPSALPRLFRKRGDLELGTPTDAESATLWYERALEVDDEPTSNRGAAAASMALATAMHHPRDAEPLFTEAVRLADLADDPAVSVQARTWYACRVLAPQRRIEDAERVVDEALSAAEGDATGELTARALLARCEPRLWIGDSYRVLDTLRRTHRLTAAQPTSLLRADAGLALSLACHQTGAQDFRARWGETWPRRQRWRGDRSWRWIAVQIMLERGDLRAAESQGRHAMMADEDTLSYQLVRLHAARVAAATGRIAEAGGRLRAALERAHEGQTPLLVPQLAARLVMAEPSGAAREHLLLAEQTMVASASRLEQSLLLRARAALMSSEDNHLAAAALVSAAISVLGGSGMVFEEADALIEQSEYLIAGGRRSDAAAALTGAGGILERAGAPARVRATAVLLQQVNRSSGPARR